jgi:hypothetical protein
LIAPRYRDRTINVDTSPAIVAQFSALASAITEDLVDLVQMSSERAQVCRTS